MNTPTRLLLTLPDGAHTATAWSTTPTLGVDAAADLLDAVTYATTTDGTRLPAPERVALEVGRPGARDGDLPCVSLSPAVRTPGGWRLTWRAAEQVAGHAGLDALDATLDAVGARWERRDDGLMWCRDSTWEVGVDWDRHLVSQVLPHPAPQAETAPTPAATTSAAGGRPVPRPIARKVMLIDAAPTTPRPVTPRPVTPRPVTPRPVTPNDIPAARHYHFTPAGHGILPTAHSWAKSVGIALDRVDQIIEHPTLTWPGEKGATIHSDGKVAVTLGFDPLGGGSDFVLRVERSTTTGSGWGKPMLEPPSQPGHPRQPGTKADPRRPVPTTVTDFLARVREYGFVVDDTRRHYSLSHPDVPGVVTALPRTPSDHRWAANQVAQIRRAFEIDVRAPLG